MAILVKRETPLNTAERIPEIFGQSPQNAKRSFAARCILMTFRSPQHISSNKLFAFHCYSTQEEEKNHPLDSTEGNCGRSEAYEQMKTKQG